MKITDIKVFVSCPGRNFVTVKVWTDEGLTGVEDATLNGRELEPIRQTGGHRGRDPQRPMEADEVVVHEVQRHGVRVVLHLEKVLFDSSIPSARVVRALVALIARRGAAG